MSSPIILISEIAQIIKGDDSVQEIWEEINLARKKIKEGTFEKPNLELLSKEARRFNRIAEMNGFQAYKKNSNNPVVYLIGHALDDLFIVNHTTQLIEKLAAWDIKSFKFLSEGYDNYNILFLESLRQVPAITRELNIVYKKCGIKPEGNDSEQKKRHQHNFLRSFLKLSYQNNNDENNNIKLSQKEKERLKKMKKRKDKIKDDCLNGAINALRSREVDHFYPHIREHFSNDEKIIYMMNFYHVISPILSSYLSKRLDPIDYISFVPKF